MTNDKFGHRFLQINAEVKNKEKIKEDNSFYLLCSVRNLRI